jgi:hypothetical protein
MSVDLLPPYASKKLNPNPERNAFLSRLRYWIDTAFLQLVGWTLLRIAGVGARYVTLDEPAGAQVPLSYRRNSTFW